MSSIKKEVIEEKEVPIAEVYRILSERAKDSDLNQILRTALQYAMDFGKDGIYSEELIQEFQNKFNLTRFQVVEILNINPVEVVDLKPILPDKSEQELADILNFFIEKRKEFGSE